MRHEWVLEVLSDLRLYAQGNDLPALAQMAEETLLVAKAELADLGRDEPPQEFTAELKSKAT